jgi:hypothetical protein
MSIRDNALPKFNKARAKIAALGLRRFAVILRRRTWSGTRIGEGTPTNLDIVITPAPAVHFQSPFADQMAGVLTAGGSIRDRYYLVDKITPAYVDRAGVAGGYTPAQLRMRVGPDLKNVEPVVVLVGDDGVGRECTQMIFEDDKSFGYSMTLQEQDKPTISLVSIAVVAPGTVAVGTSKQMKAVGTFNDGSSYEITTIVKWTMLPNLAARVDVMGKVTTLATGTATLNASVGGIAAPASTVTVA